MKLVIAKVWFSSLVVSLGVGAAWYIGQNPLVGVGIALAVGVVGVGIISLWAVSAITCVRLKKPRRNLPKPTRHDVVEKPQGFDTGTYPYYSRRSGAEQGKDT